MATGTPNARALARPLRYRRKVDRLKPGQLERLRGGFGAMVEISDDRGYQHWAGIHGLPLPIGCRNAHGTPFFLPWHRAYLYRIERALRDQEPRAMLVWWDWRTPAGTQGEIPDAYAAPEDGDGNPNPLHSAEIDPRALEEGQARGVNVPPRTQRSLSSQQSLPLPTPEEVDELIEIRDFETFTDRLDSIHGGIHMWVGGHMTQIDFAAYDPIFWAHHAMVDRIWRIWQNRHGRAGPPESIWDQALEPFGLTVRQTLSVTRLGYDYAASTDTQLGGGP
jgi:tyrosinase